MPDYMYMLESRLSAEQRAVTLRVQELAAETGSNVYLTGGAVRDLISGMFIRDLDFTVEGNPARLVRELEKGGARIVDEDERLRHFELIFSGDADGSISGARDEVYTRPGTRPEIRWSTIMEDLIRRDFSINAIAISLNPASRGLLLDPTNGLADLEKREVRALSIHSFTNRPVRMMRALRYCARLDFKLEARTADWFNLALERRMQEGIPPEQAGLELRQVAREDKPAAVLKAWESRGLIGTIHPQLARRHLHHDTLNRILRAKDELSAGGLRPRLLVPITYAVLGWLRSRELSATLHRLGYRSEDVAAVLHGQEEARKAAKILGGKKMADPAEAFAFLESLPAHLLVVLIVMAPNPAALSRIRSYLHKWRPVRQALPAAKLELEMLGMPPGPKFDKVIEAFFRLELAGKGRTPEDRTRLLRKLSGIQEPAKVKAKEEKKKHPAEKLKKRLLGKGLAGNGTAGLAEGGLAAGGPTPGGAPKAETHPTGGGKAVSRPGGASSGKAGSKPVATKRARQARRR